MKHMDISFIETRRAHSAGPQHIATSAGSPGTEGTNGRDKQNNSMRKTKGDHNTLKLPLVRQGRNWKSINMRFVCLSVCHSVCLSVCLSIWYSTSGAWWVLYLVLGTWYFVSCVGFLDLWFWDLVFRVCVFVCFCFVAETFRAGFEWWIYIH
jgi:hypothetical protein